MSAETFAEKIRAILPEAPAEVAARAALLLKQNLRDGAWAVLASRGLTPAQDFAVHQRVYELCYGEDALLRSQGPAWLPAAETVAASNIVAAARAREIPWQTYYRFSMELREAFWTDVL